MTKKTRTGKYFLASYALASLLCIGAAARLGWYLLYYDDGTSLAGTELKCAIELGHREKVMLLSGLNYEMLQRFNNHLGENGIFIINARSDENYLDSLRFGTVDIVVEPYSKHINPDSLSASLPIDSMSVWVVRADRTQAIEEIDNWLDIFLNSEEYPAIRDTYLKRFNPAKRAATRKATDPISPYDSLFKKYAPVVGWDWRLLAAVSYTESQFHIEALSKRGASGLFQIMPRTASRFHVRNLFDPEDNIQAAAKILANLRKNLKEDAANETELTKYTLAAYNAGEGRIRDCIRHSRANGGDTSHWESLVESIASMRDKESIDTSLVRHGAFKGVETISFVEKVLATYSNFRTINRD